MNPKAKININCVTYLAINSPTSHTIQLPPIDQQHKDVINIQIKIFKYARICLPLYGDSLDFKGCCSFDVLFKISLSIS